MFFITKTMLQTGGCQIFVEIFKWKSFIWNTFSQINYENRVIDRTYCG